MTDSPEHPAATTDKIVTATPPVVVDRKPNRLYTVAAWVGIVAGTVFIVAVIFFSGFILGRHSGGGHGHGHFRGEHHGSMMMERGGPPRGPFGGPGMFGPPPGAGNFGPGGPAGSGPQTQPPAPPTR